ncbi:MAG: hypothetical protein J6X22_00420 [Muribaculaceae bacterium]|nr:hypothetical protein [Muribaculaceae bacterium]
MSLWHQADTCVSVGFSRVTSERPHHDVSATPKALSRQRNRRRCHGGAILYK